jgi:hypothetical protein
MRNETSSTAGRPTRNCLRRCETISSADMRIPCTQVSSLPGLTRQSIILAKKMDARVKPAHDEGR